MAAWIEADGCKERPCGGRRPTAPMSELAADRSENWRKSAGQRCGYDQAADHRYLDNRQASAFPDDAVSHDRGGCQGGGGLFEVGDAAELGASGMTCSCGGGSAPFRRAKPRTDGAKPRSPQPQICYRRSACSDISCWLPFVFCAVGGSLRTQRSSASKERAIQRPRPIHLDRAGRKWADKKSARECRTKRRLDSSS